MNCFNDWNHRTSVAIEEINSIEMNYQNAVLRGFAFTIVVKTELNCAHQGMSTNRTHI